MLNIIYNFYTIPETYHWIKVMHRWEDTILLTFHLLYLSTSFYIWTRVDICLFVVYITRLKMLYIRQYINNQYLYFSISKNSGPILLNRNNIPRICNTMTLDHHLNYNVQNYFRSVICDSICLIRKCEICKAKFNNRLENTALQKEI